MVSHSEIVKYAHIEKCFTHLSRIIFKDNL